jgi:hypothetical protein
MNCQSTQIPVNEEGAMPKKQTATKTPRAGRPRNLKPLPVKVQAIKGGLGTVKGESKDDKHGEPIEVKII